MNRHFIRAGALLGTCALATLAGGPALAASTVSQASAQSLQLSVGGNSVVSQKITATNDGSGEQKSSNDTLPDIAHLLPANSLLGPGVAPQDAGASVKSNGDGHSFACAGLAGTGGGIVHVGSTSCDLNGQPITLDLGNLKLGDILIGADSSLGNIPGITDLLNALGAGLNQVVTQVGDALKNTPLGNIDLAGSLSAIAASCTADPGTADGLVHFVDTSGNTTPISLTLPAPIGKLTLVNLPVNPPVNTHVLVNLDTVVKSVTDALGVELTTILDGKLDALGVPLSNLLKGQVQTLVNQLVAGLQPLLKPLQDNVLDITLNKQPVPQAAGTFQATALDLQVLPALKQVTGASLISGDIGTVSCGPNGKVSGPTPTPTPSPTPGPGPHHHHHIPKHVDSGLADYQGSHQNVILAGTTALLALAGGAGTLAYRRYWMPRG